MKIFKILPGDRHVDSSAPTRSLIEAGVSGALLLGLLHFYGKISG